MSAFLRNQAARQLYNIKTESDDMSSSVLINKTLGQLLDDVAFKFPKNEALVAPERDIRMDYREFVDIVNRVAKGLYAIGVRNDDKVAVWATNYPEWVILQYATARIGAILVSINSNYKADELSYVLKQADVMTLILSKGTKTNDYVAAVNKILPTLEYSSKGVLVSEEFPHLKNIIYLDEEVIKGMYNFRNLFDYADHVSDFELKLAERRVRPEDVVNIQFTSGTTGSPKGVMLTHYNLLNNAKFSGECMKLTEKDRLCISLPMFHCIGSVLGSIATIIRGASIVLLDHFNPITVMQTLQNEKCTAFHGVPTMFISILNNERFDEFDLSSLRTGIMAGAPCPVEVMKKVIDRMHMEDITIAYGQTEASPICTQTAVGDPMEIRISTIGKTLPYVECKIVDPETNCELPAGTQGELVARGYNIMKGYYKMPEATAKTIDEEGWLHTGDLAVCREDGYFHITGRIKDMIIRGGENIYPKEVEDILYVHPQVKEVQVIGVPHERYGEVVMAYIIPVDDAIITEQEIKDFVRENGANHKIPHYVAFVNSFPLTASGKIQKYKLKEKAIIDLNLQDAANIVTA